jgi:hypothetical protein
MGKYSIEKGRRKAVGEFTNRQGLTMLGIVGTIVVAILLLWIFGYLRLDVD